MLQLQKKDAAIDKTIRAENFNEAAATFENFCDTLGGFFVVGPKRFESSPGSSPS